MALIELHAVARHYQHGDIDVPALDDVSLSIEAGEFVAIMGQSGSGKSTLMNVLGCLDNPTGGRFVIGGRDASELGADELAALRREHFGFIFQRYHLLPHLDAQANAALPAVYAGLPGGRRDQRAEELLERLGLAERMSHRPSELSGGQQQRVSIARALMNGGQIILADEPTGALDSASGAELLALLAELNARGHTIILVTHDAHVAAHARRVIELKDGRVVNDSGTPAGHVPAAPLAADAPRGSLLRRWHIQWREALQTAWLALLGNRLRTALSMLGISIGIAAVVSILALTDAARASIDKDVRGFLSGRIPVWRGNSGLPPGVLPLPFKPSEITAIRSLPGVAAVQLERELVLPARHGSRDASLQIVGAEDYTQPARKLKIIEGRGLGPLDQQQRNQVIVLEDRARDALFKPGQPALGATVMLGMMGAAPSMPQPDAAASSPGAAVTLPFTVVGIVKPESNNGMNWGNSSGQALIPAGTFATKLDPRPEAEWFSVLLDFTLPPDQVRGLVTQRLKALHGREDFSSFNAEEEYRQIQAVTGAMALLFAGVGGISLLVGGVGVMNIMLVSVSERTREIGIRMAVGARQGDVRLQFLIEAVVLCCMGGAAGLFLSWLATLGINAAQSQLKVGLSWPALALAFVVSSIVGLVFGTLPARRAAALSPVDALARE